MNREDAKRAFDEAILERLVAFNAERAAEEARRLVRRLRAEFQNPQAQAAPQQVEIDTESDEEGTATQARPGRRIRSSRCVRSRKSSPPA